MDPTDGWMDEILLLTPLAATIAVVVIVIFAARAIVERRRSLGLGRQLGQQLVMVSLTFVGLIAIIVSLPLRDATKGQLLTLIGLLVTAAIALSSTTFVGNAMAGIMLRAVRNFRTGDFVRVEEHLRPRFGAGPVPHRDPDRGPRPDHPAQPLPGE